jgi:NAD(P)-dependent dehydrogenase (short-subunit alcohol dehydrogenase family)
MNRVRFDRKEHSMSVWFITGASRGFGLEITRRAPHRGDQVAATARHPGAITEAIPDAGNALLTLLLDVTNASQAAAAVSTAIARFGRIDVLVNDAGRGLLGTVEEVSDAEARAGNVPERLLEMVLRPVGAGRQPMRGAIGGQDRLRPLLPDP